MHLLEHERLLHVSHRLRWLAHRLSDEHRPLDTVADQADWVGHRADTTRRAAAHRRNLISAQAVQLVRLADDLDRLAHLSATTNYSPGGPWS